MPGDFAQSETSVRTEFLASVLDQLSCPACFAGLRMEAAALICTGCGRRYPIIDGIPVLIPNPPGQE
jgi:uncharacterized protein YbaR (Trm112 family)